MAGGRMYDNDFKGGRRSKEEILDSILEILVESSGYSEHMPRKMSTDNKLYARGGVETLPATPVPGNKPMSPLEILLAQLGLGGSNFKAGGGVGRGAGGSNSAGTRGAPGRGSARSGQTGSSSMGARGGQGAPGAKGGGGPQARGGAPGTRGGPVRGDSGGGRGPQHGGRGGEGAFDHLGQGRYQQPQQSLSQLVQEAAPYESPQLPTMAGDADAIYALLASRMGQSPRPTTLPDIRQAFPQGTSLPQGERTGYRYGSPWQFKRGGRI